MKKKKKIIGNIISIAIMAAAIIALICVYSKYNYNDFIKSVREKEKTEFTRDCETKHSQMDSYKIENKEYNDAMFYQTIPVKPNMPYKVTCWVKVENVQNEDDTKAGGAHIGIAGETERSLMLSGTKDWQELTFLFNSKNRDQVDICFRLGGYKEMSKGIAWFSDIKVEMGTANRSGEWKMACFIFPEIDVEVEVRGKMQHVNLKMSNDDVQDLKDNLARFQTTIPSISHNKMRINYDVFVIEEPITTVSYDEENGYYVSPEDVHEYINSYVEKNEYDHIYIGIRMADIQHGDTALTSDWIGLGGMEYYGIGYSNIRLPDSGNNYAYKYNKKYNTFPEEVYVHEFLHTLERNSKAYGYDVPDLHDYSKYGYAEDRVEGQKKWYIAYMNQEIEHNGEKIGLPEKIYTCKPPHESNFNNSIELNVMQEPKNIIEVARSIFNRVVKLLEELDINTVTSDNNSI